MIEEMKDARSHDPSGLIIYGNAYFAQLVRRERARSSGRRSPRSHPATPRVFSPPLTQARRPVPKRRELELRATDGSWWPVSRRMNRIKALGDGGDVFS
jgi:hypothetical protein